VKDINIGYTIVHSYIVESIANSNKRNMLVYRGYHSVELYSGEYSKLKQTQHGRI